MRARIDVSEIEATTKIRAKYLRALENEEWGLLPGPTFVKSFLRTYAQALGLDGKALVEEYRLSEESAGEALHEPIVSSPGRSRPRRDGGGSPSRAYVAAVSVIGGVIVLLIVLLIANGGGSSNNHAGSTSATQTGKTTHKSGHAAHTPPAAGTGASAAVVSLQLRPTALVYVCLIGDGGRKLIAGQELPPGESTPVYHARHFELTLGNSNVALIIDGIPRAVAPSSAAIGYSITKASGRKTLPAGRLPTCT
jgi:hypothetical protein